MSGIVSKSMISDQQLQWLQSSVVSLAIHSPLATYVVVMYLTSSEAPKSSFYFCFPVNILQAFIN
jgi:hypothetical protein